MKQGQVNPWMSPQEQLILKLVGESAPGAMPNGTKIRKINSKPGDHHLDGSTGTVEGSVLAPDPADPKGPPVLCYIVTWDDRPDDLFFITCHRIEKA